jgi:hypothetical protein
VFTDDEIEIREKQCFIKALRCTRADRLQGILHFRQGSRLI